MAFLGRAAGVVARAVGVVAVTAGVAVVVPGQGGPDIGYGLMLLAAAGLTVLAGGVADGGRRRGWTAAFADWAAVVALLAVAGAGFVVGEAGMAGEPVPVAALFGAGVTVAGLALAAAAVGALVGDVLGGGRNVRRAG